MWYACTWTENLLKDTHQLSFICFSIFPDLARAPAMCVCV